MSQILHGSATTTHAIRAAIQRSKASLKELVAWYDLNRKIIAKWRGHLFGRACRSHGIEHRLTKPRTPKTNGMVERFNGRIADVLKTHRFTDGQDMRQTLERYVHLYNHQLPQSVLHSKSPMQAMKAWYDEKPELFHRKPRESNRPECDIYTIGQYGKSRTEARGQDKCS